ncbi:tumor necrosis factor receptor superfamily member 13B [Rhynchocyon petersi]
MSVLGKSQHSNRSQASLGNQSSQGPWMGLAMQSCPEEHYWDPLLITCVSCKLICSRRSHRICATFCKSFSCRTEPDKYYDHLLDDCINCASICGQHPKQCAYFCENKVKGQSSVNLSPELQKQRTKEAESKLNNLGRDQGSEPRVLEAGSIPQGLNLSGEQLALVYITLGLCLCAIVCCFLMAVACFLKRKSGLCSCQPPPEPGQAKSSQDHLMETGTVGCRMPEPVETCRFCFPEQRTSTEESAQSHRGQGLDPAERWFSLPRTSIQLSSNDDSSFKIICAPSQERSPTT